MENVNVNHVVNNAAQEQPLVTIQLNAQEFNTIVAALSELPHRVADGLLKNLTAQVQPQVSKFQQK